MEERIVCKPDVFSKRAYPSEAKEKPMCFVIMPFKKETDADKRIQEVYKYHVVPVAEKCGLECIRADEQKYFRKGKVLIEQIWMAICRADIIIGDFTTANPNVTYEAGIAHTLGKPLIGLIQEGEKIPFDFGHLRQLTYTTTQEGYDKLDDELETEITAYMQDLDEQFPKEYAEASVGPKAAQKLREAERERDVLKAEKDELQMKYADAAAMKKTHSTERQALEKHIVQLQVTVTDKNAAIAELQNRIADLERPPPPPTPASVKPEPKPEAEPEQQMDTPKTVQIKVIGVGGGGGNTVNRIMVQGGGVQGVELIVVNADKQILGESIATHKLLIGERTARGLGCGGDPGIGMKAAEESREAITDILRGADMVFITAGMGGGTGTGAAPIIAEISKEMGILTVGVVTKPFKFEGELRMEQAVNGIARLTACVDSLIVIPNEHLKRLKTDGKLPMREAFTMADQVLMEVVRSISDLINNPAYINLDFKDISDAMRGAGYTYLGMGRAKGPDKARQAAWQAISSPLPETAIDGANSLIINVRASDDINLEEVEHAVDMIIETADPAARVIWGMLLDESMVDELGLTVIATRFKPVTEGLASDPIETKKKVKEIPWADLDFPQFSSTAWPPKAEASAPIEAAEVGENHDTMIGMLVDKFQRERDRRKDGVLE